MGSRWKVALVAVLVAGVLPFVGIVAGLTNVAWVAAAVFGLVFVVAGPVTAALLLVRTRPLRFALAGFLTLGLAVAYLVSQHRPDSVMPPPPTDWIVPYVWLGCVVCGAGVLLERISHTGRPAPGLRMAAGAATLVFALLYSGCVGVVYRANNIPDSWLAVRPDWREAPLPPGWVEASWTRIADGDTGFAIDVRPPAGTARDEAMRQLVAFLRERRGWRTQCRPVRGILEWGRHCLTVAPVPDDPVLLRVTVVREAP